MSEEEYIRGRVAAGDKEAVGKWLYDNQSYFRRIAFKKLGYAEADDAVQEAFIKVIRFLHLFDGKSSFKTWVGAILKRVCYDMWRFKDRRVNESPMEKDYLSSLNLENLVSDDAEVEEVRRAIEESLKAMPGKYGVVMGLLLQGYSYEEVTEMTNTTIGTTKSRSNRARIMLKQMLESDPRVNHLR